MSDLLAALTELVKEITRVVVRFREQLDKDGERGGRHK